MNEESLTADVEPSNVIITPREEFVKRGRKGGLAKGKYNRQTRHQTSMAKRFKACGLDWQEDFAKAILAANDINPANKHVRHMANERIKLWVRLLPYLIITGQKMKAKKWTGKASKAAKLALEVMEQETRE